MVQTMAYAIDFAPLIRERTTNFAGREWLFDEIDRWLANPQGPPAFLITGEPGSGKSAIAARFTQMRAPAAYHFCIARQAETIDPLTFARSISHQLTAIDEFGASILEDKGVHVDVRIDVEKNYGQIIGVHIENLLIEAPSATVAFNRAVLDPLRRLSATGFNRQLVIVVDGLDESMRQQGPETIVDLLASERELPLVRFVLTSRPDAGVLRHFEPPYAHTVELDARKKETLEDLQEYVGRQIDMSAALQERLAEQPMAPQAFVDLVTEASKGNFLYLAWLLPAIAAGTQRFDALEDLPTGLDGIYREFLRTRGVGGDVERWRREYRPLLGVLAVARKPLLAKQLMQFTGLGAQKVDDILLDVQQFLEPTPIASGLYQLYHQSVADFLGDRAKAREFWIEPGPFHRRIVQRYRPDKTPWGKVAWQNWDAYGVRHLIAHLVAGGAAVELDGIKALFSREYLDYSKRLLGSEIPFLDGVKLVLRHAKPAEAVALCRQVLYSLPANSYRALTTLSTLVELARTDKGLQETLHSALQGNAAPTLPKAILVLATEDKRAAFQDLRALQQHAPSSDLFVIYLAYGLAQDPAAQDELLNVFVELDKRSAGRGEARSRLYEADYIHGWYAAEGLRAVGRTACTEATIERLLQMLQAPEARNQMWALYILSRWGAEDGRWLGKTGDALKAAVRRGLQQRRSEGLCARAADAVKLLPDLLPREEAVGLLSGVLGVTRNTKDAVAANPGKWLYAKKRAVVALGTLAIRDPRLLEALSAFCEAMKTLAVDAKDEPDRRGLVEELQEAIGLIELRE